CHDLVAGQAQVDVDRIKFALVLMLVRRLDGHSAADDVGRKALEFLDALADLGLHRRRSIEVVKANLYRELHDGLTALVRSGGQCSGSAAWRTLVDIRMLLPGERRRRRGRAAEA